MKKQIEIKEIVLAYADQWNVTKYPSAGFFIVKPPEGEARATSLFFIHTDKITALWCGNWSTCFELFTDSIDKKNLLIAKEQLDIANKKLDEVKAEFKLHLDNQMKDDAMKIDKALDSMKGAKLQFMKESPAQLNEDFVLKLVHTIVHK